MAEAADDPPGRRPSAWFSGFGVDGSLLAVREALQDRYGVNVRGRFRGEGRRWHRYTARASIALVVVALGVFLLFVPALRGVWRHGPGRTPEAHALLVLPGRVGVDGEVFILSVREGWASPADLVSRLLGDRSVHLRWHNPLRIPPVPPPDPADDRAALQSAIAAGLRCAGVPVSVAGGEVEVDSVTRGAPRGLVRGARIVSVEGGVVRFKEDVYAALAESTGAGAAIVISYPGGGWRALRVPDSRRAYGERGLAGVELRRRPVTLAGPRTEIKFRTSAFEGDSLGLAAALTVADLMAPRPLVAAGTRVAATGSISPDGLVGPVGIPDKMAAARRLHASVVLVPASEYDAARRTAGPSLRVVGVRSLDDALAVLSKPSCASS